MNTVDIVTSYFETILQLTPGSMNKKTPSTYTAICVHTGRHIRQKCSDDVTHILNGSSTKQATRNYHFVYSTSPHLVRVIQLIYQCF